MDWGGLFLLVLAVILAVMVGIRCPSRYGEAFRFMRRQAGLMALPVPLAMLTAAFGNQIIPAGAVGDAIGDGSGWRGILVAILIGAMMPGGPMIAFPMALALWQLGAGQVQTVALLSGWSVFAIYRIMSFELPLMGPRFVALRLASSWMLPALSALIAGLLLALGDS